MKRFKEVVSAIFYSILGGIISSIVLGIIVLLAVTSIYQAPFITVVVALCFVPFHFSDFKRFYLQKDWFVIFGRFFCLVLISAFLVGLFRAALETIQFNQTISALVFTLVFIPSLFFITTYFICLKLFPAGGILKKLESLIEGSKKFGVFWDY